MCAATGAERAAPDSLLGRLRALPADRRITAQRSAGRLVADVEALARELDVVPGEPIAFRAPNGEPWIVGLLALLAAGASPLLVSPDAPRRERDRLLAAAGGGRELVADDGFRLDGAAGRGGEPAVLLTTSGSTGEPKLLARTEESLVAEGLRFESAVGLHGLDRLVLPLPLSHAYALGWLAAALVTGTEVRAHPPSSLAAVERELADGATIIALVPTLARLLALRRRRRGGRPSPAPGLRLAMVGAGPVDERLDEEFRAAYGLSTGRNYGSTETGALFAGLGDLPPLCVGAPMPGVRFRVLDDGAPCPPGREGRLEVRVDDTRPWHDTGDLAVADELGRVRILGRTHGAVRKGGRWISPLEVEAVLREAPGVSDAHVRSRTGRYADEELLIADVAAGPEVDEADVLAHARTHLSGYKVPDRVHLHRAFARDRAGKRSYRQPRYRLAGAAALEAMRSYRRSELLFALDDLDLLEPLRCGADLDELSGDRGLPAEQVAWLLDIAAALGLVTTGDARPAPGLPELLRLERELSRTWLTRESIAEAVRAGRRPRPFDVAGPGGELLDAYPAAMHGAHVAGRTRLGVRLLGEHARGRVLEVSAGPGRYLSAVLTAHPRARGHLLPLGPLAGPTESCVEGAIRCGAVESGGHPPPGEFDAVVVANGIHGPAPGADVDWLLSRLVPGGVLLVDDVFLPEDGGIGAELGLDWLTHGGTAWPRAAQLHAAITDAGGSVVREVRTPPPDCRLILVEREGTR
ncbi:class I adenylate-forming enzyme family protein [Saccharopolyspora rosea]|uniref:class I adenylate-forming enzyme family protein n=1 Tax=Saccharopolyspora rosea TaxID=524884 RepID=UPI0021DAC656|nr:fatty acid--CoA ligase family protein [Saccharopolyspora rosea]